MPRTRAEIGSTGLPIFSGYLSGLDPNKRLVGREKIKIYRDMAYNEPAAVAFLSACRHLLRTDYQVQPGGDTDPDKRAATFLEECLDDMRESAATQTRQLYSMIWAGYSYHELVYKRRSVGTSKYPDGRVGWAAWALRRQESQERWEYDVPRGRITGWTQRPAPTYDLRTIPITKAVHVVADDSEGSPEGTSLLRGMYKQWFFCQNVEILLGISLERFGTGIPVFEQTEDNTTQLDPDSREYGLLEDTAASLRQNEEAYVILPRGFRFRFEPSPGLDTNAFLMAIQRYRLYMLQSALADFIMLGTEGGAYALGKDKSELFLLALTGMQERLLDALNRQAVARLIRYNRDTFGGALTALPKLTLPAVRRYDLEALAGFAQILHSIGAFHPTPEDEELFRKISDLSDIPYDQITQAFKQDAEDEEGEPTPTGTPQSDDADEDDDGTPDEQPAIEEARSDENNDNDAPPATE